MKHVYAKINYHAENYALHYLRTKDGQEVGFAMVKDHKIEQIIEVKNFDGDLSKSLLSFHKKYDLSAIQVVKTINFLSELIL